MAIDQHYIPAFSIEDVLLDKDTGAPLSGGKVYFEKDNQRGTLKPIYQITGTSPAYTYIELDNPVILSSIGTFEDLMGNPVVPYFFPYVDTDNLTTDLYYVRVTSSDDVPQFTRQAVPYISSGGTTNLSSIINNEISNPQFATVNFDTAAPSYTYTFTGVTDEFILIAPNWTISVTAPGTGSIEVTQIRPLGSLNIETNPGTSLRFSSTGLTKFLFIQRLFGSPNLWGSGYLSSSFVARTGSGSAVNLDLYYSQSSGGVLTKLLSGALLASGNYKSFSGSKYIDVSTSVENYPDAYIDIFFEIPVNTIIEITSVMIAFTGATSVPSLVYDQESDNRQIDHLFHYYKPRLEFMPIPSLLTAWDFPLNPKQFGETSFTNSPKYVWDQTIMCSSMSTVNVSTYPSTGALVATTSVPNEAFYFLQYLSKEDAILTTFSELSVNIDAYSLGASDVIVNAYIYYSSLGGTIPIIPTTIGSIVNIATGEFSLSEPLWTETLQLQPYSNRATLPLGAENVDTQFKNYLGRTNFGQANNNNFAIVVTFACPTSGTLVFVNSISCVPGTIPTRPAPQTADEVLRECEYYYEQSYSSGGVPYATVTDSLYAAQSSYWDSSIPRASSYATPFSINFRTLKRTTPRMLIYDTVDANIGYVQVNLTYMSGGVTSIAATPIAVAARWTEVVGLKYANYTVNNISSAMNSAVTQALRPENSAAIRFHYIANARLGEV